MSRKKILWICSWYPNKLEPFNGDFIQRQAHAAALRNDVFVLHLAGDDTGVVKETGEVVTNAPGITEKIIYFKKHASFPAKLLSHYKWLHLSKKAIRKYIIENGKPDIIHVNIPVKAGYLGLWAKKKYDVPYVVTEHWGIYNEVEVYNYESKNSLFKQLTKKVYEGAAVFISVIRYLAEGVNRLVMQKKYTVVPNVVDTNIFYYQEKQSATFRFLHVSNMVQLKNAEGILRAFKIFIKENSNAERVMVGDTTHTIREYAASLGFPKGTVSFRGEVSYQHVATEMQLADCFILFSNIENSPCVIGEALCCGLPVIASNVGGIPELVDETNSLLVEPGNENILANAMREIMSHHSSYNRKKIAEKAQKFFSYPVISKQLDEIYTAVLSTK